VVKLGGCNLLAIFSNVSTMGSHQFPLKHVRSWSVREGSEKEKETIMFKSKKKECHKALGLSILTYSMFFVVWATL